MPRTRRSLTIAASAPAIWDIVGNPSRLPRWWPRVERVEQVTAGQFTEVLRSERGRTVRADHRLTELTENEAIAWEQELEGTPFERVMTSASTSVQLAPDGDGLTKVTVERRQDMRGMARFGGGFMLKRATARVLDEALGRLADQLEAG